MIFLAPVQPHQSPRREHLLEEQDAATLEYSEVDNVLDSFRRLSNERFDHRAGPEKREFVRVPLPCQET
jgi:hypothetical protein